MNPANQTIVDAACVSTPRSLASAAEMPSQRRSSAFDWNQADWFGVFCSVGCAIHCAAMPILMAFLPSVASLRWLADPIFHQTVAILCGAAIARSLWPDWQRHRDPVVATAGLAGLGLLILAAFVLPDLCCDSTTATTIGGSLLTTADLQAGLGEFLSSQCMAMQPWLTPIASVLLVVAHVTNIRLRCCAKSACVS